MGRIESLHAREILDSRGNPTVEVTVGLERGIHAHASVPSGASTGKLEAVEKRDGDPTYFNGKGVKKVIDLIHQEIAPLLIGQESTEQQHLDQQMIDLDGTPNKSRLGANGILGVSLAIARASSMELCLPLYRYLGGVAPLSLPVPMMNLINGGAHADNALDIQEFMIVPHGAKTFSEAMGWGVAVMSCLRKNLQEKGFYTGIGDEGGLASNIHHTHQALDFLVEAIEKAGLRVQDDISIALDVAASELYQDSCYHFKGSGKSYDAQDLVSFYQDLLEKYPIISIEDPMGEEDEEGWRLITEVLGSQCMLIGDDLFVTNPKLLQKGLTHQWGNGILIKPNQIGTLTETLQTIKLAQSHQYQVIMSHRSGETGDTFISDLAVSTHCGWIKAGAPCRGERVEKYNQLWRIESQIHKKRFENV